MGADERGRLRLRFSPTFNIFFELVAELGDGVFHGPSRAVGQAANRGPRNDTDRVSDFQHDIQILAPPFAPAHPVHDFQQPARPLAARGTLPARLVSEELAAIVKYVDDAGGLVEDDDS